MWLSATLSVWSISCCVVLLLALFRRSMTRGDYTVLHMRGSELSLVPEQIIYDRCIKRVELWGQALTVVALIFKLSLAAP
jgi:hypothetical protein